VPNAVAPFISGLSLNENSLAQFYELGPVDNIGDYCPFQREDQVVKRRISAIGTASCSVTKMPDHRGNDFSLN
jgi:hypothetical protein